MNHEGTRRLVINQVLPAGLYMLRVNSGQEKSIALKWVVK